MRGRAGRVPLALRSWWRRRTLPLRIAATAGAATAVAVALVVGGLVALEAASGQVTGRGTDEFDRATNALVAEALSMERGFDSRGLGPPSRVRVSITAFDDDRLLASAMADELDRATLDEPAWVRARAALEAETAGTVVAATGVPPRMVVALGAAGLAVLLLVAATTWFAARRALRPVAALSAEVKEVGATDLHRRLAVPEARDDVRELAVTMNGMLARLEQGASRQRRFVADASHELRSPVAGIAATVEVALRHPDRVEPAAVLAEVGGETDRLGRLVAALLDLARMEEVALPATARVEVDLDDVVLEQVRVARRVRPDVRVQAHGVGPARVLGEPGELARAVRNLLENATKYARSEVVVALTAAGGRARLVVDDDGPGIPESDRERVLEPFVRLDGSRARASGGTGLGLALVREVVRRHDGTVAVGASPAAGARLVLHLPAAPPPTPVGSSGGAAPAALSR